MTVADIGDITGRGLETLARADTLDELDAARAAVLGRRSQLTAVQRGLGELAPEQRRELGAAVNAARAALAQAEATRRAQLEDQRDRDILQAEAIDVTLPPRTPRRGSLHPLHETLEAMTDVFVGLGYQVVAGPEVESEWFNFTALNAPPDHPSRSLQDTIYVRSLDPEAAPQEDGTTDVLLRPQTSPAQVRVLLAQPPPVYVVVPGRVYRQETTDATHLAVFHQIEGLAVDADLSMRDLRGTLGEFARALIGPKVRLRFRPHYFPFTEPSAELDVWYDGHWMELLGAGMVHPHVLRNAGHDPEQVQGFAFGMGIDRFAMLRHGVRDIRLFVQNDVRFLRSLN